MTRLLTLLAALALASCGTPASQDIWGLSTAKSAPTCPHGVRVDNQGGVHCLTVDTPSPREPRQ